MKTKPTSTKKPVRKSAASRALVRKPDAPVAPAPAASAALVAMPEPGEALDRAGRANFFHRLSREAGMVSIRAALAAGMELLQAKEELAGGFVEWVKHKCDFGSATAYRYIALVQKTLPEQSLPKLLSGSDAEREAAIERTAAGTDSRTLTELYDDLGIVRKTPSNLGGARPGAGRKPKCAEKQMEEAVALATEPELADGEMGELLGPLSAWALERDGVATLSDEGLGLLLETIDAILKRAKAVREERRARTGRRDSK